MDWERQKELIRLAGEGRVELAPGFSGGRLHEVSLVPRKGLRVIVAGSRGITEHNRLERAMLDVQRRGWVIEEIVSGGARGVDKMGERWARDHGVPFKVFVPDWNRYGRGAGPLRNEEMAVYADALVALWDGSSRGTRDMIARANAHALLVATFTIPDGEGKVRGDD